jgi:hypothetical protein
MKYSKTRGETERLLNFMNKHNLTLKEEVIRKDYFGVVYYFERDYPYVRLNNILNDNFYLDIYIAPHVFEKLGTDENVISFLKRVIFDQIITEDYTGYSPYIWIPEGEGSKHILCVDTIVAIIKFKG